MGLNTRRHDTMTDLITRKKKLCVAMRSRQNKCNLSGTSKAVEYTECPLYHEILDLLIRIQHYTPMEKRLSYDDL